jgi:hypothetical protein
MSHHHNQLQTAQEERRKETHDKLVFLNLLLIEGYSLFLLSKLIVYWSGYCWASSHHDVKEIFCLFSCQEISDIIHGFVR